MKSPSEAEADKECHFFRLPPEVRLTIYQLVIETSPPAYFMKLGHLPIRPSLLTTNRLIRSEAMKAYYRRRMREYLSTSRVYIIEARVLAFLQNDPMLARLLAHYLEHRWKKYTSAQDACLRAAAALRLENSRLQKDGWPIEKWSREILTKWTSEAINAWELGLGESLASYCSAH